MKFHSFHIYTFPPCVFIGTSNEHQEGQDDSKLRIIPCLPAVSASLPEKCEGGGCYVYVRYLIDWFLFIISFPFLCMFTWTIPNCSEAHNRKYFLASFFASILWIAILSFCMVTLVGRVGCILSVDKFTMGLVVVAIGTSIPVSHLYC
jgi:Ca2+/Na+ antiporter